MPEDKSENAFGHTAGTGILLIPLPELDPPLAPWLAETASDGIGAHLTVLAPFLSAPDLTGDVLAELRRVFDGFAAFDVEYARTARFPEVLYLEPSPDRPVREMTAAVYARWPQCPPYGGTVADPIPHTTVVYAKPEAAFERARQELAPLLPLRARAAAVDLVVFDGSRWNLRERFPLAER
jgi:hypothetical protein